MGTNCSTTIGTDGVETHTCPIDGTTYIFSSKDCEQGKIQCTGTDGAARGDAAASDATEGLGSRPSSGNN